MKHLLICILFLGIVQNCISLDCETCKGFDCFKSRISKERCRRKYPSLPFKFDINPSRSNGKYEYGCLDLQYYKGKIAYQVKQCLPVITGECICEQFKDALRIKRCSFSDRNRRTRRGNNNRQIQFCDVNQQREDDENDYDESGEDIEEDEDEDSDNEGSNDSEEDEEVYQQYQFQQLKNETVQTTAKQQEYPKFSTHASTVELNNNMLRPNDSSSVVLQSTTRASSINIPLTTSPSSTNATPKVPSTPDKIVGSQKLPELENTSTLQNSNTNQTTTTKASCINIQLTTSPSSTKTSTVTTTASEFENTSASRNNNKNPSTSTKTSNTKIPITTSSSSTKTSTTTTTSSSTPLSTKNYSKQMLNSQQFLELGNTPALQNSNTNPSTTNSEKAFSNRFSTSFVYVTKPTTKELDTQSSTSATVNAGTAKGYIESSILSTNLPINILSSVTSDPKTRNTSESTTQTTMQLDGTRTTKVTNLPVVKHTNIVAFSKTSSQLSTTTSQVTSNLPKTSTTIGNINSTLVEPKSTSSLPKHKTTSQEAPDKQDESFIMGPVLTFQDTPMTTGSRLESSSQNTPNSSLLPETEALNATKIRTTINSNETLTTISLGSTSSSLLGVTPQVTHKATKESTIIGPVDSSRPLHNTTFFETYNKTQKSIIVETVSSSKETSPTTPYLTEESIIATPLSTSSSLSKTTSYVTANTIEITTTNNLTDGTLMSPASTSSLKSETAFQEAINATEISIANNSIDILTKLDLKSTSSPSIETTSDVSKQSIIIEPVTTSNATEMSTTIELTKRSTISSASTLSSLSSFHETPETIAKSSPIFPASTSSLLPETTFQKNSTSTGQSTVTEFFNTPEKTAEIISNITEGSIIIATVSTSRSLYETTFPKTPNTTNQPTIIETVTTSQATANITEITEEPITTIAVSTSNALPEITFQKTPNLTEQSTIIETVTPTEATANITEGSFITTSVSTSSSQPETNIQKKPNSTKQSTIIETFTISQTKANISNELIITTHVSTSSSLPETTFQKTSNLVEQSTIVEPVTTSKTVLKGTTNGPIIITTTSNLTEESTIMDPTSTSSLLHKTTIQEAHSTIQLVTIKPFNQSKTMSQETPYLTNDLIIVEPASTSSSLSETPKTTERSSTIGSASLFSSLTTNETLTILNSEDILPTFNSIEDSITKGSDESNSSSVSEATFQQTTIQDIVTIFKATPEETLNMSKESVIIAPVITSSLQSERTFLEALNSTIFISTKKSTKMAPTSTSSSLSEDNVQETHMFTEQSTIIKHDIVPETILNETHYTDKGIATKDLTEGPISIQTSSLTSESSYKVTPIIITDESTNIQPKSTSSILSETTFPKTPNSNGQFTIVESVTNFETTFEETPDTTEITITTNSTQKSTIIGPTSASSLLHKTTNQEAPNSTVPVKSSNNSDSTSLVTSFTTADEKLTKVAPASTFSSMFKTTFTETSKTTERSITKGSTLTPVTTNDTFTTLKSEDILTTFNSIEDLIINSSKSKSSSVPEATFQETTIEEFVTTSEKIPIISEESVIIAPVIISSSQSNTTFHEAPNTTMISSILISTEKSTKMGPMNTVSSLHEEQFRETYMVTEQSTVTDPNITPETILDETPYTNEVIALTDLTERPTTIQTSSSLSETTVQETLNLTKEFPLIELDSLLDTLDGITSQKTSDITKESAIKVPVTDSVPEIPFPEISNLINQSEPANTSGPLAEVSSQVMPNATKESTVIENGKTSGLPLEAAFQLTPNKTEKIPLSVPLSTSSSLSEATVQEINNLTESLAPIHFVSTSSSLPETTDLNELSTTSVPVSTFDPLTVIDSEITNIDSEGVTILPSKTTFHKISNINEEITTPKVLSSSLPEQSSKKLPISSGTTTTFVSVTASSSLSETLTETHNKTEKITILVHLGTSSLLSETTVQDLPNSSESSASIDFVSTSRSLPKTEQSTTAVPVITSDPFTETHFETSNTVSDGSNILPLETTIHETSNNTESNIMTTEHLLPGKSSEETPASSGTTTTASNQSQKSNIHESGSTSASPPEVSFTKTTETSPTVAEATNKFTNYFTENRTSDIAAGGYVLSSTKSIDTNKNATIMTPVIALTAETTVTTNDTFTTLKSEDILTTFNSIEDLIINGSKSKSSSVPEATFQETTIEEFVTTSEKIPIISEESVIIAPVIISSSQSNTTFHEAPNTTMISSILISTEKSTKMGPMNTVSSLHEEQFRETYMVTEQSTMIDPNITPETILDETPYTNKVIALTDLTERPNTIQTSSSLSETTVYETLNSKEFPIIELDSLLDTLDGITFQKASDITKESTIKVSVTDSVPEILFPEVSHLINQSEPANISGPLAEVSSQLIPNATKESTVIENGKTSGLPLEAALQLTPNKTEKIPLSVPLSTSNSLSEATVQEINNSTESLALIHFVSTSSSLPETTDLNEQSTRSVPVSTFDPLTVIDSEITNIDSEGLTILPSKTTFHEITNINEEITTPKVLSSSLPEQSSKKLPSSSGTPTTFVSVTASSSLSETLTETHNKTEKITILVHLGTSSLRSETTVQDIPNSSESSASIDFVSTSRSLPNTEQSTTAVPVITSDPFTETHFETTNNASDGLNILPLETTIHETSNNKESNIITTEDLLPGKSSEETPASSGTTTSASNQSQKSNIHESGSTSASPPEVSLIKTTETSPTVAEATNKFTNYFTENRTSDIAAGGYVLSSTKSIDTNKNATIMTPVIALTAETTLSTSSSISETTKTSTTIIAENAPAKHKLDDEYYDYELLNASCQPKPFLAVIVTTVMLCILGII